MMRLKTLSALVALGFAATGCSGSTGGNDLTSPFVPGGAGDSAAATDVNAGSGSDVGAAGSGGGVVNAGSGGNVAGNAAVPPGSGGDSALEAGGNSPIDDGEPDVEPIVNPDGSLSRPFVLDGEPIYTRVMRLTNAQWELAVQDVLRLPEPPGRSIFFEDPVTGATDFLNNEALLNVTNTQWGQYQTATEAVVEELTATDAAFAGVYSGTDADGFIREVGQRAFRRPLTPEEVQSYRAIYDTGAALSGSQSDYTKGAGLVVEALLQSPHFLYRTELGPDGAQLSGYEIAAKLSLVLRNRIPDEALMTKAAQGTLDTVAGVAAEAQAMLDEPEVVETFNEFHAELFEFSRFADVDKQDPAFTPAVASELVDSAQAFFTRIYEEDLGLKEVLTTTQGFVGPATASLYGVSAAGGMSLTELGPERAGFFSQLPYLMVYARGAQSYGILRGVHINNDVLCAELEPPQGVLVQLANTTAYTTSRELMEISVTPCGTGCHDNFIDPLGFAFENFDGLGRWRDEDNGAPVDATGTYPFVGGAQSFDGAAELMAIIATNEAAHKCYAKNVAGFTLQREIADADMPLIEKMATSSVADASVKELVMALIQDPAFHSRPGAAQ